MNDMDLEKLIDGELKRLPLPAAPPTLLPRVMAGIETRLRRPWYRRAWSSWPSALRLASACLTAAILVGLVWVEPMAQRVLNDAFSMLVQPASEVLGDLRALFSAAESLRRAVLEPVLGYLLVLALIMGTVCAGLGAALTRMASLGGTSR